jgi:hypothetical protein
MFFAEPSSSASSGEQHAAKTATSPQLLPVPITDPLADLRLEVPKVSADDSSNTASSSADAAMRSAMYGRYLGQIGARISRAWLRPRSAIGAATFSCRVRIDQDSRGNVEDVTLEDCNGNQRWRLSLVRAIESASPLPAPPDPSVFTRIVHATFEGRVYEPGLPEAQYEPAAIAQPIASASQQQANAGALSDFAEALRKSAPKEVVPLTLSGRHDSRPLRAPSPSQTLDAPPRAEAAETPPSRGPGESNP